MGVTLSLSGQRGSHTPQFFKNHRKNRSKINRTRRRVSENWVFEWVDSMCSKVGVKAGACLESRRQGSGTVKCGNEPFPFPFPVPIPIRRRESGPRSCCRGAEHVCIDDTPCSRLPFCFVRVNKCSCWCGAAVRGVGVGVLVGVGARIADGRAIDSQKRCNRNEQEVARSNCIWSQGRAPNARRMPMSLMAMANIK